MVTTDIINAANDWIANYPEDKDAIGKMSEIELSQAFSSDVHFGTAGVRGIMSPGTARFNMQNVLRITKALATYMKQHGYRNIAVCFDTRHNSSDFAVEAAHLLAASGMDVYIACVSLPTPFLSFIVRNYKMDMGIMITASHNSKEYNGYKVFNSEGCQISEETADEIQKIIQEIPFKEIRRTKSNTGLHYLDTGMFMRYIDVCFQVFKKENATSNISVLYTPLNGVGIIPVTKIAERIKDIVRFDYVKSQMHADPDFTTCPKPNPEIRDAWNEALECADNEDLIIATDADADRLGVAVLTADGYRILNGNEEAVLLLDYLCVRERDKNILKDKYIVRTNVTTSLLDRIAKRYGIEVRVVDTGFKNICANFDEKRFFMGAEEAMGSLVCTHIRDKDAMPALLLFLEMTSAYKSLGITLIDRLEQIREEYGTVKNIQFVFENTSVEYVKNLIESNDSIRVKDCTVSGKRTIYTLEDGTQITCRASGTEPKVKLYVESYNEHSHTIIR